MMLAHQDINFNKRMNLFSVRNKVILITGTSRGIGRSIAEAFLNLGSIVIGISKKKILRLNIKIIFILHVI